MTDEVDAFGYREAGEVVPVFSLWASEGKDAATLEPIVVMYMRRFEDSDPFGVPLSPEIADALADQLHGFAQRARDKHWDR